MSVLLFESNLRESDGFSQKKSVNLFKIKDKAFFPSMQAQCTYQTPQRCALFDLE